MDDSKVEPVNEISINEVGIGLFEKALEADKAELYILFQIIRAQIKITDKNIFNTFNYAKVTSLFEKMQARVDKIKDKAKELKEEVGQTESDLKDRYRIIQLLLQYEKKK